MVAVLAGGAAAVLLGSDVHTTHDGQRLACSTVINAAAVDPQPPADLTGAPAGGRAACHDALVGRTGLAGLALMVCAVAATGARRQDQETIGKPVLTAG